MLTRAEPLRPLPATIPARGSLIYLAATSTLLVILATWFLLEPEANPFRPPESVLARMVVGPAGVAVIVLLAGLAGIVTVALVGASARDRRRVARMVTMVAAGEAVILGAGLQGIGTVALAGYLLAMALPAGVLWLGGLVVRRYRRGRWLVLPAAGAIAAWAAWSGSLRPQSIVALARDLGHAFAAAAEAVTATVLIAAAAAGWVGLLVRALSGHPAARTIGSWLDRHRRAVTLLAAAGPLPYALVRASWLTPWPLFAPGAATMTPDMRLWGLLLGGAALLGSVLTVGLLRPWGVVFPRWMPWWAGRPVPVAAAVVPGGLVAGVLCASAVPMLRAMLAPAPGTVFDHVPGTTALLATLVFPFYLWGPALGLAVWAYARARRSGA